MYEKMVEGATSLINGNVKEFVKHWRWDVAGVKGDGLSSSRRCEAVKETSMTATKRMDAATSEYDDYLSA